MRRSTQVRIAVLMVSGGLLLASSAFAEHPMTSARARLQPDFFRSQFYREKNQQAAAEEEATIQMEKSSELESAREPEELQESDEYS